MNEKSPESPVAHTFASFRAELDARHDKHERLVKISRDITITSKRIIFLIHRINGEEDRQRVIVEVESKLSELERTKWKQLVQELKGEDPYQYLRAYSAGMQEYIEAVCLYYFTKNRVLPNVDCIQQRLAFSNVGKQENSATTSHDISTENNPQLPTTSVEAPCQLFQVHIPPLEYILGMADVTGELMRIAVHHAGVGDRTALHNICAVLRGVCTALGALDASVGRELSQKLSTLRQSVAKVENACYALHVRRSEFPDAAADYGKNLVSSKFEAVPPLDFD